MTVFTIKFEKLLQLVPNAAGYFRDVCKGHDLDMDVAIDALYADGPKAIDKENAVAIYADVEAAFTLLNDAFKEATTVGDSFLELDPQDGEDGSYLRVKYAVTLSPAARKIADLLVKDDLTVFGDLGWDDAETAVTGV